MNRYPALIDGSAGAYGVVFPDVPGNCAMGNTIDEALLDAEDALHDYAVETRRDGVSLTEPTPLESIETSTGTKLVSIPPIEPSAKSVRASLTLDASVAEFIDNEARRRGMTRKSYITWMARRFAAKKGDELLGQS